MPPRVVLVGPPGAGKSTVAALVAGRLGVAARDVDADVERAAGCTVAELFAREGEAAFRALERRAVARALAEHDGVLALGGGAVLDPATRRDLAGLPVASLAVSWDAAAPRLGAGEGGAGAGAAADAGEGGAGAVRPLLAGDPRQRWTALLEARRALYAEVATVTVATDGLSPEQVADRVLAALGS